MRTILISLFTIFSLITCAQIDSIVLKSDTITETIIADSTLFIQVHSPQYPGGIRKLSEFLRDHIYYSNDAIEAKIEGTVYLTFLVNEDGSISDVTLLEGIYPSLDNIAMEAIRSMPAWIPGMIKGKPAKQEFTLPVKFTLPRKLKK